MDAAAIRPGIEELIADYIEVIDEDRLEEWPDLFTDPYRYLVISRSNFEAGMRHGVMYAATRGMMVDRIYTLREANLYEPHRYRHTVGPVRVRSVAGGTAAVDTAFMTARIMHTGETMLFATGRYIDKVDVSREPYRFKERTVVLDSDRIDTLLAIPL